MNDREQITALMDEWRRLTAKGDLQDVLALMTDDAVFPAAAAPPFGRREIRDFHACCDTACAWSYLTMTMTPKEGKPVRREGDILTVFRRGADGKWRLARDANFVR